MLVLSDSEEDEDYDTALQIMESKRDGKHRKKHQSLCLEDDDDDDEESDGYLSPLLDQDKENTNPDEEGKISKRKQHPDSVRKTVSEFEDAKMEKKTPNPKPKKVRRRSSARFLRLSGRFHDEDDEGMDETPEEEQREKLNEMYSKAIQLNAANKINAVNSWGLNIIDKMDKFLGDDEEEEEDVTSANIVENRALDNVGDSAAVKEKRVNFTKASCTIDACVKIYSYRVDDAHLTSYKVLANLNRTDGGKGAENTDFRMDSESLDNEERNSVQRTTNQKRLDRTAGEVKTIEANIGKNIECKLFFLMVNDS
jgi:condensin complex subunit 2